MKAMLPRETLIQAVDCVSRLVNKIQGDKIEAFRARARDLPTMMFSNGFAYTLVFIASRGSVEAIELGLRANSCDELVESITQQIVREDRETAGYIIYGSLLLYLVRNARLTEKASFNDLLKESLENNLIDRGAQIIAEWVKRLAEAYIS